MAFFKKLGNMIKNIIILLIVATFSFFVGSFVATDMLLIKQLKTSPTVVIKRLAEINKIPERKIQLSHMRDYFITVSLSEGAYLTLRDKGNKEPLGIQVIASFALETAIQRGNILLWEPIKKDLEEAGFNKFYLENPHVIPPALQPKRKFDAFPRIPDAWAGE